MALDDRKRKVEVVIVRPGATEPEERKLAKEPHHIQRLFRRLRREGRVEACYDPGVSGYDLYRLITACQLRCHVGSTTSEGTWATHASPLPRIGEGSRDDASRAVVPPLGHDALARGVP